jgi:hypothetical protein
MWVEYGLIIFLVACIFVGAWLAFQYRTVTKCNTIDSQIQCVRIIVHRSEVPEGLR